MYRRIVLAVDPEGLAESVLPIVAALARRGGGEVFVVGAAKASDLPEHTAALEKHVREAAGELNAAGMMTVRPQGAPVPLAAGLALAGYAMQEGPASDQMTNEMEHAGSQVMETRVSRVGLVGMIAISFVVLAAGIGIAGIAGNLTLR